MLDSNCRYPLYIFGYKPSVTCVGMLFIMAKPFLTSEMRCSLHSRSELKYDVYRALQSFHGSYHLPGLDRERFKLWKGALALNQSRSSTGAFVSSYVQSILGKARARGATSVYCDAILAMSSWSCMLICCWGLNKDWGAGFNIGDRLRTAQCVVSPS